jgi:hypothetical protein
VVVVVEVEVVGPAEVVVRAVRAAEIQVTSTVGLVEMAATEGGGGTVRMEVGEVREATAAGAAEQFK